MKQCQCPITQVKYQIGTAQLHHNV